jgi:hypothetical protein
VHLTHHPPTIIIKIISITLILLLCVFPTGKKPPVYSLRVSATTMWKIATNVDVQEKNVRRIFGE